jgi:RNA polymerase sigma-70 factor (ECF subfamily)
MPSTGPAARIAILDVEPGPAISTPTASVPTFPQIYSAYFGFVWSCTRRLGVNEAEIDDLVQEIFIVIHARLHTLKQPEALRSWIYGIVRRTVSTHHRAKRAKQASTSVLNSETEMRYPQLPSPQELAEQSDQARLLWSLLEKLDAPKREVFVLAELDEMTVPEIASAIEVPVNTVYSRLRAARQELEEALTRHQAQTAKRGRSCPT